MKSISAENPNYMIPDYFKNPVIRPYLKNVRDWQGYIRFLGLPDRRENPDVLIDRLFVAPLLTRRYVSPDESPENWADEAETLIGSLVENEQLVLLGDPGIGKSTFLNYVAWLLSRPATNTLIDRLGWRLPLPMVLRELEVRGVKHFDGLLEAFLKREMSAPLREDDARYLRRSLEEGQAFLLLDGIDELGDRETRENLRSAVFDGMSRYPACRWLLTSRIVGYDEAPFDTDRHRSDVVLSPGDAIDEVDRVFPRKGARGRHRIRPESEDERIVTRHIAPFDDRRIAAFASNWYAQREAAANRAETNANHLVRAVHADRSILRLARVPNLLTMMALIHRIEATLPHGRALLYERIVEAYLESIDRFRGLSSSPHDLPRKKGWLARVAFEMQRRRISETWSDEANILMDADTVRGWLGEEMERSNTFPDTPSAEEFLKIVGRRSGLFLPRGEGRYAFVHLSFQEYFAAVAIEREVTRLRWARGKESRLGFDRDTLGEWAGKSVWRETFSFLFELLASEEEDDWHADLLDCVFGKNFSRLKEPEPEEASIALGHLLARLVVNSRSGLSASKRDDALAHCVSTELRRLVRLFSPNIFRTLLGDDVELNTKVFRRTETQMEKTGSRALNLSGTRILDLSPVANLTMLQSLNLMNTNVSDISSLADLPELQSLDLVNTGVSDISPLANLAMLQTLDLAGTSVSDISPLASLPALRSLDLRETQVSDLAPLMKLDTLQSLNLTGTPALDLAPVMGLRNLRSLRLEEVDDSNLDLLANLPTLRSLVLSGSVSDLSPFSKCLSIQEIYLEDANVSNLSSLTNLPTLREINCHSVPISDLSPLAKIPALESLVLGDTLVSDLAPLSSSPFLHSLELWDSISDLSPLANLTRLRSLTLGFWSADLTPLTSLTELQELHLFETQVSDLIMLIRLGSLKKLALYGMETPASVIEKFRKCRPDIKILQE